MDIRFIADLGRCAVHSTTSKVIAVVLPIGWRWSVAHKLSRTEECGGGTLRGQFAGR
jgi:hypothetical protein